jgi:hypothetical protein
MSNARDIFKKLRRMDLSQQAKNLIVECDQFAVIDIFGRCETAEDVEEAVTLFYEEN